MPDPTHRASNRMPRLRRQSGVTFFHYSAFQSDVDQPHAQNNSYKKYPNLLPLGKPHRPNTARTQTKHRLRGVSFHFLPTCGKYRNHVIAAAKFHSGFLLTLASERNVDHIMSDEDEPTRRRALEILRHLEGNLTLTPDKVGKSDIEFTLPSKVYVDTPDRLLGAEGGRRSRPHSFSTLFFP